MNSAGTPVGGIANTLNSATDPNGLGTILAKQRLISAMMQPPAQNASSGWGGLANAGSMMAGALAQKNLNNQINQMSDPNYGTFMTRYGMTPQQVYGGAQSSAPGTMSAVGQWLQKTFGGGS